MAIRPFRFSIDVGPELWKWRKRRWRAIPVSGPAPQCKTAGTEWIRTCRMTASGRTQQSKPKASFDSNRLGCRRRAPQPGIL